MQPRDLIPPILRYLLEEAYRPRSQGEIKAYGALALGLPDSIKDMVEAKHQARRQLKRRQR